MKLGIAITAAILAFAISPAQARHHHRHHYRVRLAAVRVYGHRSRSIDVNYDRPSDCYGIPWCGCFMRHIEGVADKTLNLAREWAHWGHAVSAQIGAIVVWPHHVGKIVGGGPGHWLVLSGNDGHRVRERVRSVAGAIAFREP